MPSTASPTRFFRQVVEDRKQPLKIRLEALNAIPRPSLALLSRLVRSGRPKKLAYLAAQKLQFEIQRRSLVNADRQSNARKNDSGSSQ